MGDFGGKSAISVGSCDVAAALKGDMYAKELLEMRKFVEKLGGSYDEADKAVYLKFLLGCSLKPEKAAKKFVQFQNWRASYMPLGYIPDSEVSNFLASETISMVGKSKKGWPVLVAFPSKGVRNPDLESLKRFFVYIMDKTMSSGALLGSTIAIVDMNRVSLKHFDLRHLVLGFQIQEKYYPGIVDKLYIVNSPKVIIAGYKLISPLLPKLAKERVVLLESHEIKDALLSEMDVEVLPRIYGGRGEIMLLQDVKAPNWRPAAHTSLP